MVKRPIIVLHMRREEHRKELQEAKRIAGCVLGIHKLEERSGLDSADATSRLMSAIKAAAIA